MHILLENNRFAEAFKMRFTTSKGETLAVLDVACCPQGLVEVTDQIVRVLEADGDPDEVLGDPEGHSLFLLDGGVRHKVRQLGQRLVAAKGLGQGDQLQAGEELPRLGELSLQVEGDHAGVPVLLALDQLVLRVGREAGVADRFDGGVGLEELADGERVALVLLHADLERLEGAVDEVAVEGRGHGADGVLQEADAVGEGVVVEGHGAHDHVGVAVHVLGARVVRDVGAELQGSLQNKIMHTR